MSESLISGEQRIHQDLSELKEMMDIAFEGQVADYDGTLDAIPIDDILGFKRLPDGDYYVWLNNHVKEVLTDAEQGESTHSSLLVFNGSTLSVTEARIDVLRLNDNGKVEGYERQITDSRLPGFVASVTLQVTTELGASKF